MGVEQEREEYEDAIREDIRREILTSTSRGRNRYMEQIEQIHREEREREKEWSDKRYQRKKKKVEIDEAAEEIVRDMDKQNFRRGYLTFCGILVLLSVVFLGYVWRTIALYEETQPGHLIDKELASIQAGESVDSITFPELAENAYINEEELRDIYIETLQNSDITYRFLKQDYETGDYEYTLYANEEAIGKITLEQQSEEKKLGFLPISYMRFGTITPKMDHLFGSYDIRVLSTQKIQINDVVVTSEYLVSEEEIPEFSYLYEYLDMPKANTYHIEEVYKNAEIKILNADGSEAAYKTEGEVIDSITDAFAVMADIPENVVNEIDVLEAAKTWSLFTTRDLSGAYHGLDQVRKYFIRESYYWQKLGEYATGIDITLVSDHSPASTYFTEEQVTDYKSYGENCFSCRIVFNKHMQLNIGREQVDKTNSIFYFIRIDDTDDGIDNPTWKIADIQAVVA